MTTYEVLVSPEIYEFFQTQSEKIRRIVKENLRKLDETPYPERGSGDEKRLPIEGEKYCMHIGRTWTVFYSILEDEKEVRVSEILPIDEAYKKYGY